VPVGDDAALAEAIIEVVEAFDRPKRIVSLGPAITEGIYLLGQGDSIVGVTNYCIRPPDAQKKERVGGVTNISVEKISRLKPDIIIATPLTDIRALEKLKRLGFYVVHFTLARDFNDVNADFLKLGGLIGRQKEADEIVRNARRRLDELRSKIVFKNKPRVFVQIGARPLFTITDDSFVNDMITLSGGINIAQGAGSGVYSREKVVEQNPDVILIMNMGIATEEERTAWLRYKTMNAVRHGRIYAIDSYRLGSPTPITFVETVEELINLLHKDKIN
ncbi:MAG: helical backbone metal receptor, partial [Thermodesulfovibrionales bacterium]